ncbi:hypothetical protein LTR85_001191 [Meristemomyces frigidus]|nr:hypothetical protein LTR85_001191 [Meristemomyces frigidus]
MAERSHQVRIMDSVYENAQGVLIWLGLGDPGIDHIFNSLSSFHSNLNYLHWRASAYARKTQAQLAKILEVQAHEAEPFGWHVDSGKARIIRRNRKPQSFHTALLQKLDAQRFERHLMSRTWFHRMWTMQELLLGPTRTFHCGTRQLDGARLLEALRITGLMYNAMYISDDTVYSTLLPSPPDFRKIARFMLLERAWDNYMAWRKGYKKFDRVTHRMLNRPAYDQMQMNLELHDTLAHARVKGASEPRDKIFAMYGLLKRSGIGWSEPDYEVSVEEVYCDATIRRIRHDKSLDVLCQVTGLPSELYLPSWVPDWSDRLQPILPNPASCLASGGSRVDCHFAKDGLFKVYGRPVNRVKVLTTSVLFTANKSGTLSRLDTVMLAWMKKFLHLKDDHRKRSLGEIMSARRLVRFSRVLCFDRPPGRHGDAPAMQMQRIRDYVHLLGSMSGGGTASWFDSWTDLERHLAETPDAKYRSSDVEFGHQSPSRLNKERLRRVMELREQLAVSLAQKAYFEAFDGYLGIASSAIQVGDDIVLLAGLGMPLVVRPVAENLYRMISPAFVDGYMEGQAWQTEQAILHGQTFNFE